MAEIGDGAWYVISIAAQRAEVHEQTLRHYGVLTEEPDEVFKGNALDRLLRSQAKSTIAAGRNRHHGGY